MPLVVYPPQPGAVDGDLTVEEFDLLFDQIPTYVANHLTDTRDRRKLIT